MELAAASLGKGSRRSVFGCLHQKKSEHLRFLEKFAIFAQSRIAMSHFKKLISRKFIFFFSFVTIVLLIATIAVCNHLVERAADRKTYDDISTLPHNEVALVLGAPPLLHEGKVNPYFVKRMEAAAALYHAGKIDKILLSGRVSHNGFNEPQEMRATLMEKDVPDSILVLDEAGTRTLELVVRCKKVFGLHRLTIISQQFHNKRALYIARAHGIDAVAFNANDVPRHRWLSRMKLREWLARYKAVVEVTLSEKD